MGKFVLGIKSPLKVAHYIKYRCILRCDMCGRKTIESEKELTNKEKNNRDEFFLPNDNKNKKKYYLMSIPIFFIVLEQTFAKIGASYISITNFNVLQFLNIFTIISVFCLITRGILWFFLFMKFDLAFVYPFMSVSYIFILIISCILFNEELTVGKIIGSLFITLGVFFVSLGEKKKN